MAIKAANTGYYPPRLGVSCDLADGMYVPGLQGAEFRDLAYLFGRYSVQVELALTTIMDTLSLRAEQEQLSHYNGMLRIDEILVEQFNSTSGNGAAARALDWFHPFKYSWPLMRQRQEMEFERAEAEGWFTQPDVAWLRARPLVHGGHL